MVLALDRHHFLLFFSLLLLGRFLKLNNFSISKLFNLMGYLPSKTNQYKKSNSTTTNI